MSDEDAHEARKAKEAALQKERLLARLRELHMRIMFQSQHNPVAGVIEDLIAVLIEERGG